MLRTKVIATTVSVMLAMLPVGARAVDCLTAGQLGSPGPYYGGAYNLGSNSLLASMGSFKSPSTHTVSMGQPQLVPAPGQCQGSSTLLLSTNISNLQFLLQHATSEVTIEFCDGASENNLSVRPLSFDYVGDIASAPAQLPGLGGAVNVRVTMNGGPTREGSIVLDGGVQYVSFGGTETMISKICVQ